MKLTVAQQCNFSLEIRPPQNAEMIKSAIFELVEHLELYYQAPVRWTDSITDQDCNKLVLELDVYLSMAKDAFEIDSQETEIIIRSSNATGLEHGVHHFLEKAFGIKWLWPGDSGRYIPAAKDSDWPQGKTSFGPDWVWRRIWLGGAFYREKDPFLAEISVAGISQSTYLELEKWQQRQKLGGLNIADGHRWAEICSPLKYGKSNPDFFALVNGKRDTDYHDGKHGNQPCTSNSEVIDLTANYIINHFDHHHQLDGFSLAVNDGHGFCECSSCKALDQDLQTEQSNLFDQITQEMAPGTTPGATQQITDRMLTFANSVAEKVAEKYPDKHLLFLIYGLYRTPPQCTKLAPNVIAQFCSMSWSHTNPEIFKREMNIAEQLGQYVEKRGIYDYFINGTNGTAPRGFSKTFTKSIKHYYDLGFRYFATQASLDFSLNGFNYYLASKLLWNTKLTYDEILDDYSNAFEDASDYIKAYINNFVELWENNQETISKYRTKVEPLVAALYTPKWIEEQGLFLQKATQSISHKQSLTKKVEFLATGLEFLTLYSQCCQAVVELLDNKDNESCKETAQQRRAELYEWVSNHNDNFWISALWFNYQIEVRNGYLKQF